ncbi:TadE/TadG family type IV pilus assembly protein [Sulfobacillus thermosulfidooxidans]|uniref:TadE/TadG family type IV pilus assembly protein n=1 Tax=Sulfobacillus thermosulfidooxidans TaxID=28034 RepID=UPI0006B5B166|nr:TadE family protein [Sulfobacillus thermosulfidooxidans]
MKRVWNHICQDHQGQALVEFALMVPLLLLFLFAIIQMGLIFSGFISIEQGARAGVRAASLGENSTQIGCAIYNQINTGLFPNTTVVTWTAKFSNGNPPNSSSSSTTPSPSPSASTSLPAVGVTVSTSYPLLVSLPGFGTSVPMNQHYTMIQEGGNSTGTETGSFSKSSPPSSCP